MLMDRLVLVSALVPAMVLASVLVLVLVFVLVSVPASVSVLRWLCGGGGVDGVVGAVVECLLLIRIMVVYPADLAQLQM